MRQKLREAWWRMLNLVSVPDRHPFDDSRIYTPLGEFLAEHAWMLEAESAYWYDTEAHEAEPGTYPVREWYGASPWLYLLEHLYTEFHCTPLGQRLTPHAIRDMDPGDPEAGPQPQVVCVRCWRDFTNK